MQRIICLKIIHLKLFWRLNMEKELIYKLNLVRKILKNREKDDNLSRYNKGEKVHLKQMEFHKCNKKNRWVFG